MGCLLYDASGDSFISYLSVVCGSSDPTSSFPSQGLAERYSEPLCAGASTAAIPLSMQNEQIPRREDIDVYGSLDEARAVEHFVGKSLDEAEALFRENSLYYEEDLLWMGPVAFRFYIHAAINYVQSEHSTGDCDIINCLAGTLSFWHECYPAELVPCAPVLEDFCRTVLEQFDRFDAHPGIHACLREKYQHLAELFTHVF
jgi:hypothetical protein